MTKHKNIKMIFSFCLALVMLLSPLMDITANAVAVELGYATYVIISMMAAAGITFTATGGVEALQSAVEDWVDEYDSSTGTKLTEIISLNTAFRPPSNNGGPGLAIGAAAVLAFSGFLAWLLDDKFSASDTVSSSLTSIAFDAVIDGVPTTAYCTTYNESDKVKVNTNSSGSYYIVKPNEIGTVIPMIYPGDNSVSSDFFYVPTISSNGEQRYGYFKYYSNYVSYMPYAKDLKNFSGSTSYVLWTSPVVDAGYNYSQIVGLVPATSSPAPFSPYIAFLLDDGNIIFKLAEYMNVGGRNEIDEATITVPQEVTEYSPSEGEVLDLDFEQFGDSTATNVEELVEEIKQSIIATGTAPVIDPSITPDPSLNPDPTPVPTPNPSPEYEDIESLGLPALGEALMDKFPFCLPRDLGRLLDIFIAERQTPKWEVDLFEPLHGKIPMQGDTTLSIDFAEFEEIGQITRWASVIGFCLFLLVVTKEFITW